MNAQYHDQDFSEVNYLPATTTFNTIWNNDLAAPGLQPGIHQQALGPVDSLASIDLNTMWNQDATALDLQPAIHQQALAPPSGRSTHPCTQPACPATFRRQYERARHEAAVHGINRGLHHCPIVGCTKSHGAGYSRADKVTEHLWKKHANLGYTKSR